MIAPGIEVRFRRRARGRWHTGTVTGVTDRGTAVWVRDTDSGASRCLRLDRVELPAQGPKGGVIWMTAAAAQ